MTAWGAAEEPQMTKRVKDLMLSLSEYAVVDEDATILDALRALAESQAKVPAGKAATSGHPGA